jgi:glyoxylase-like metal-dependent hydrolase (beta-lactamase superfamily II)
MRIVFAAIVGVFLAAGSVLAQGAPPVAPVILPEKLQQIAPAIWIIPDESRPMVPNVGFVVGQTSVLVIDTGMGDKNGAIVADVARKLAPGKRIYLVTTHFHPEHDMGANGFPKGTGAGGSTLLRSVTQVQDITEFGCSVCKAFSDRSPDAAALLKGAAYRAADVTFEKDHALDLGGVRAYIFAAGANHTRGDTAIWIESEKVLFSGDIVMKAQPSFGSPYSTVSHWLSTLDDLAKLQPRIIVPSHGPTGGMDLIAGYKNYLTEIKDRAASEKKAGRSEEEAVNTVNAAMADRFADKGRLAGAVRAAFKENSPASP